jgi:PKD domain
MKAAAANLTVPFFRRRPPRAAAGAAVFVAIVLVGVQFVFAAPPEPSFTVSNASPLIGQTVNFLSTTTDPDGDGQAGGVAWDFNYDGVTFTADARGPTASTSYASPGPRTVAMQVTDGTVTDGTPEKRIATNPVRVNAPPTAAFTFRGTRQATPTVPDVGETVNFNAGGSTDRDGTINNYEWDLDGNANTGPQGFETDPPGAAATASTSYATPGTRNIRLRVTDNAGGRTVSAPQPLRVNALPVASITHAVPSPPLESGQNPQIPLIGQRVNFTGPPANAAATDAEAPTTPIPNANYTWDLNEDGTFGGPGETGRTVNRSFPTARNWTVKLQLTDADGGTDPDGATVTVKVNTRPVAAFVVEPLTPLTYQEVTFVQNSRDPDGDALTFAWDLDNDGVFGEVGTGTQPAERGPSVKRSFPSAGTHPVKLRVTDPGGARAELTRQVTVQNTVPTAVFDFGPTSPLPGEPVTFTSGSRASPPPPTTKKILRQEWDFDYNPATDDFAAGDVDATGSSVSHAFASAGPKTIGLKVIETNDGTTPAGFDIEVKPLTVNAPPQASFNVAPTSPFAGDTVTFLSTSSDPDGQINQAWDTDNDGQFDDTAGPVASRPFGSPGSYTVRLLVVDSNGATAVAAGRVGVTSRPVPPRPAPRVLSADVDIEGSFTRKWTRITRLIVHAPVGAQVGQRCKGRGCPKGLKTLRMKRKRLRLRAFERRLRPGAKITIPVTMPGFIGTDTQFTIRRGMKPKRVERCLQPGAKKPNPCPPS